MHHHHDDAKKSQAAKIKSMVGSHDRYQHPSEKAHHMAGGGWINGRPALAPDPESALMGIPDDTTPAPKTGRVGANSPRYQKPSSGAGTTISITSPAEADEGSVPLPRPRPTSAPSPAAAPPSAPTANPPAPDPYSPASTGGGSEGYNLMVATHKRGGKVRKK